MRTVMGMLAGLVMLAMVVQSGATGGTTFASPPPFCRPGQDPSTCVPWRPTPPAEGETKEGETKDGGRGRSQPHESSIHGSRRCGRWCAISGR